MRSYTFGKMRGGKLINEHILVAEKALGRRLIAPECVHHIDEDKSNNDPSNLVICPNPAYHALLHIRMRALKECGDANLRQCGYCRQWDEVGNMANNAKRNPNGRYVHRSCHANYEYNRREGL